MKKFRLENFQLEATSSPIGYSHPTQPIQLEFFQSYSEGFMQIFWEKDQTWPSRNERFQGTRSNTSTFNFSPFTHAPNYSRQQHVHGSPER